MPEYFVIASNVDPVKVLRQTRKIPINKIFISDIFKLFISIYTLFCFFNFKPYFIMMHKALLIIFLIFSTIAFAKEEEVKIPFSEDNAKYWQYISDQTMGGVSTGQAVLEKDEDIFFARLIGNVSTANNGGFIQLRSTLSFVNLYNKNKPLKGVRLNTRGNGETYHIFIRTSETRSYSDFYYATFATDSEWHLVDLPFTKFKHRFSNSSLDGNDIRTFGIVAYGRDFFSDVSVSDIIFYY